MEESTNFNSQSNQGQGFQNNNQRQGDQDSSISEVKSSAEHNQVSPSVSPGGQDSSRPENMPPDLPRVNDDRKWLGVLSLLIIAIIALYFLGFWGWLGGKLASVATAPKEATENVADVQNADGGVGDEVEKGIDNAGGAVSKEKSTIAPGKGEVSFVVSAGLTDGAVLVSGEPNANLEVRKVWVHNPYKNSWILIYEGSRQLDLKLLSATKEKQELIKARLAALDYDKVRIQFADLFIVNLKSNRKVARQRTVDMAGIRVKENKPNTVNIEFNIDDFYRPIPSVIAS